MAEAISRTSGRVNIEQEMREVYEQLTRGQDAIQSPFRTMKDVFIMAVCIGYENDIRTPLSGSKHQPFLYSVLSEQIDVPILKAVALSSTQDVNILRDFEDVVAIAEEYANYGIRILRQQLLVEAGQPLWSLVEMIS